MSSEEQRRRWREANARYRATEKGRAANRRASTKDGGVRQKRWYYGHLDEVRFRARHEMSEARARKKGARIVEFVDARKVWERDNGVCYLCALPVELLKMSIDHVVPLSRGGEHSYSNCRLSHATCNRKKYNKLLEVAS